MSHEHDKPPAGLTPDEWTALLMRSATCNYAHAAVSLVLQRRATASALAEVLLAMSKDLEATKALACKLAESTPLPSMASIRGAR